jgi:hypothetical protein
MTANSISEAIALSERIWGEDAPLVASQLVYEREAPNELARRS